MKKLILLATAILATGCALTPQNRAERNYGIKSTEIEINGKEYTVGHNEQNRTVFVNANDGAEMAKQFFVPFYGLAKTIRGSEEECRAASNAYLKKVDDSCHVYGERQQYINAYSYVFNYACAGQPEVSLIKEED